ncbi:hypothetical protein CY35_18G055900 [Sphagnum magellanicum]|jgi:uncharacterized protein YbjT (DUF2867 family)|nr:hypothetical protein CY35_18G055900 [Sphagnum magellanicum]
MGKSKILVLGATGYIGKYIAKASARLGHPTFVVVRPDTTAVPNSARKVLLDSFTAAGITILHGDLGDHESILAALKQVDVVISTISVTLIADQLKLIDAIKEVGHIKRFLPSEFGVDVERTTDLPALQAVFKPKAKIRTALRESGIPYTLINANNFAAYYLPTLLQEGLEAPPRDKITILGDGNAKAIYVDEDDIATITIKSVDDPRTLNKQLVIRPPTNVLSFNEVIEIWEKKIGHKLEKSYVPESTLQKQLAELPFPNFILPAVLYSIFVAGDEYFELGPEDAQAIELYPDFEYKTVSSLLDKFV